MKTFLICRTRVNTGSFVAQMDDSEDQSELMQAVEAAHTSVRGTYTPPIGPGDKCATFRVLDMDRNGENIYVFLIRAVPLH